MRFHCAALFTKLCIAMQNLSNGDNVVSKGPLPDAEGTADLLGDHDAAEVIDPADDTGCFHISSLLVMLSNHDASICKKEMIIPKDLLL